MSVKHWRVTYLAMNSENLFNSMQLPLTGKLAIHYGDFMGLSDDTTGVCGITEAVLFDVKETLDAWAVEGSL